MHQVLIPQGGERNDAAISISSFCLARRAILYTAPFKFVDTSMIDLVRRRIEVVRAMCISSERRCMAVGVGSI